MSVQLEVVHDTRYRYAAPVSLAHHLAHLQPLQDAHQELLHFELQVEPKEDHRSDSRDAMGNAQRHFSLVQPHRQLHVRAISRVRLTPRFQLLQPQASPPWAEVAERMRYVARAPLQSAVEYTLPSPYVPRLAQLHDYGVATFTPARPLADAALELMHRIHDDFTYQSQSTQVDTPLLTVLQQRRGVCQDFAHLMAGVLRMWGLPARYVSGYLLTDSGEDAATIRGADASHAWVQVRCPDTPGLGGDDWLDLDPTNDVVPGDGHVRLAVGRDFSDVTPLRGVIRGGGRHTLTVGVSTQRIEPGAQDSERERELLE